MRLRGFTLVEVMVTVVILAVLLAIGVGYLSGWRESNRIQAAYELLEGDLRFAAEQARALGLTPSGSAGAGTAPPQPDTELYVRVVRKEAGQPLEILKQHPIGKGFRYQVSGDVLTLNLNDGNFQGVAYQIAPQLTFEGTTIVFGPTGQPVTLAGAAAIAANPPTLTFGTSRRAVEITVSAVGAVQSRTLPANPF